MIAGLLYYWSMPENPPNSNKQDFLYDAIKRFVSLFPTAYNLLVFQTTTQRLFAVRDPLGIRPLTMCIGRDKKPQWYVFQVNHRPFDIYLIQIHY